MSIYSGGRDVIRGPYQFAAMSGPALSSTITLLGDVWAFGASSMQGAQQAASPSGGTEDSLTNTVRVIETLIAGSLAYTTVGGSQITRPIDYNLTGANSARKIRNRGVGGQTSGSGGTIVTTITAAAGSFGASDFMILHQGDNGLAVPSPNVVEALAGGFAAMRVQAGARALVQIGNTRGGRGSAGSLAGEPPGGAWSFVKEASKRVESDLNPGRFVSFHDILLENSTAADANDTLDLDQGFMPRSYAMDDGSHQIGKGYNLQSDVFLTPVVDAVAGGIPFPVRQIIETTSPTSPAAGDVIGNIVAYGSAGNFALDPGNIQTSYAVSASGQITRIGATPPARDITWASVRTTKTGRAFVPSPGVSALSYKTQPRIGICERAASGVSKLVEFDGFSMLGMPDSKLADGPIITLLLRLQHFSTAVDQQYMCGANGSLGWSITLRTTGVVEVRYRNAAVTAVNAFSKDTTGTLFSAANAPNGRWLAISIDMSDAVPANRRTHLVTWVDPSSPITDTVLLAGADQPGNVATTTINVNRSSPWVIGNRVYISAGNPMFRFRIADFTVFTDFIDFTVLANRQEVSNADGTPKTAWVSSGGVTATRTPYIRLAGNAGDFRQCRLTGSGVPATPGALGQYMAHSAQRRGDGEFGYLVTVP